MTGPEHYQEAERLARFAEGLYDDAAPSAGPREEYDSADEFAAALEEDAETHEQAIREMAAFSQLAQVHATLAQAAATALRGEIPRSDGFAVYRDWEAVAGAEKEVEE